MKKERKRVGTVGIALWCVVALVVAGVIVMAGLLVRKARADEQEADTQAAEAHVVQKPVAVATLEVKPTRLPDAVTLPGRIEPFVAADLAAEKPGRVVALEVDRGDPVDAGQLLLQLNPRLWKTVQAQAEIEHREAEKELRRYEELKKTGGVSDSEFEQLRKGRDLAGAALDQAAVHLDQCEVHSPIRGQVEDRYVEVGEYVMEGQRVLKVVDVDRLKLLLDVPERDVGCVTTGQAMTFRVAACGSREFRGTVTFVAALASPGSNSFQVEVLVANEDRALKPGMIANVELVRKIREDAVVVPLATVVPRKGEHIVFLVVDGHAVRRTVQIDAIVGQQAVLAAGVSPGDRLVVAGHRTLQDGAPVEIAE